MPGKLSKEELMIIVRRKCPDFRERMDLDLLSLPDGVGWFYVIDGQENLLGIAVHENNGSIHPCSVTGGVLPETGG